MRKVTDICRQKNNENKFSVYIDGEYDFSLYYEDLVQYNIKAGDDISDTAYNLIYGCAVLSKAKQKALNYLSFKMRTEKEIRTKLAEADFSDGVIMDVLQFLKKYNYVNDCQYAKSYIKEKSELKKYGKYKLLYDLKTKGIKDDLYGEILEGLDYDKTAYELVCKKMRKKVTFDDKTKTAVYNYLIRKGYTNSQAKGAIEKYLEES